MSIQSDHQLSVTRAKLALLEERMALLQSEPVVDAQTRRMRRSLQRLINQLKEEIARFQSQATTRL